MKWTIMLKKLARKEIENTKEMLKSREDKVRYNGTTMPVK